MSADPGWGTPPPQGYGMPEPGPYPGAPPPPGQPPVDHTDYYTGPDYGDQSYGQPAGDGYGYGYGGMEYEQMAPPSYPEFPDAPDPRMPPPAYNTGPQQQMPDPSGGVTPLQPLPHEEFNPQMGYVVPETSDSLRPEMLLRGRKRAPTNGWRRALYKVTGGMVQPGESPAELRRRELVSRTRTPVAGGHHRVAVMSLKGGVGKTTTTVSLGSTLAALRGDRVIAVDANPDRGTLSDKVRLETAATVRDLLNERVQIQRYADVRAFTSQAPSRLEVLASDRDPAVSEAFSEEDYRSVANVLEHFYSICLTDCGTGLLHSAMSGVLGMADQIVLVSSPSVDGARSASATLDWLEAHAHGDLVRNAVVVLSMVRPRSKSSVDIERLEEHFAARCRSVVRIPYDPHLEEGAEVDLDQLGQSTTDAYLQLAAMVGDAFAWR
jgi:MinD-like ATPase involved in chromosome partitioning or flagellar assembly